MATQNQVPPAPRVAIDSRGKAVWLNSPALIAWLRQYGASFTRPELQEQLADACWKPVNYTQVSHVLMAAGVRTGANARARAYKHRVTCEPPLQKMRLLGPADKEHFVTVTGDCLVTSDWHIPHHHEELLHRLLSVAKRLSIKQLVINGDFLNEDAFSRWPYHPFNVGWQTEKYVARDVIKQLVAQFERIYYILDNHDRRIIARHERPTDFTADDFLDLLFDATQRGVVRASIYYHMLVVNETWRVTSPKDYRRAKLSLPSRLAQLHHTNVISGGDHLFGLGVDDSARYVVANNCCMVNPAEVPYTNVSDTSFPQWSPGFYAIVNNVLHPFVLHENLWPSWWKHINTKEWKSGKAPKNTATSVSRVPRVLHSKGKLRK